MSGKKMRRVWRDFFRGLVFCDRSFRRWFMRKIRRCWRKYHCVDEVHLWL